MLWNMIVLMPNGHWANAFQSTCACYIWRSLQIFVIYMFMATMKAVTVTVCPIHLHWENHWNYINYWTLPLFSNSTGMIRVEQLSVSLTILKRSPIHESLGGLKLSCCWKFPIYFALGVLVTWHNNSWHMIGIDNSKSGPEIKKRSD